MLLIDIDKLKKREAELYEEYLLSYVKDRPLGPMTKSLLFDHLEIVRDMIRGCERAAESLDGNMLLIDIDKLKKKEAELYEEYLLSSFKDRPFPMTKSLLFDHLEIVRDMIRGCERAAEYLESQDTKSASWQD
jgi:hypothetical protein